MTRSIRRQNTDAPHTVVETSEAVHFVEALTLLCDDRKSGFLQVRAVAKGLLQYIRKTLL